MLEMLFLLLLVSTIIIIYSILTLATRKQDKIQYRLNFVKNDLTNINRAEVKKGTERNSTFKKAARELSKFAPASIIEKYNNLVLTAGKPLGFEAADWAAAQIATAVILPVLTLFLTIGKENLTFSKLLSLVLIEVLLGFFAPRLYLNAKAKYRCARVQEELANAIDLLTICVEAGGSFDASIMKIVEKMKGPISEEFSVVLSEIRLGKTRAEALKELAKRIPIDDIKSFVNTIIQSDKMGLRLGNILRIQSVEIRESKRHKMKQKIAKSSIKMLIPMVVFIVPTIMIISLGPAVINLINMLKESTLFK